MTKQEYANKIQWLKDCAVLVYGPRTQVQVSRSGVTVTSFERGEVIVVRHQNPEMTVTMALAALNACREELGLAPELPANVLAATRL